MSLIIRLIAPHPLAAMSSAFDSLIDGKKFAEKINADLKEKEKIAALETIAEVNEKIKIIAPVIEMCSAEIVELCCKTIAKVVGTKYNAKYVMVPIPPVKMWTINRYKFCSTALVTRHCNMKECNCDYTWFVSGLFTHIPQEYAHLRNPWNYVINVVDSRMKSKNWSFKIVDRYFVVYTDGELPHEHSDDLLWALQKAI